MLQISQSQYHNVQYHKISVTPTRHKMLPPSLVGPRNGTPTFFLCCKQEITQLLQSVQSYSPRYVTRKHKNKTRYNNIKIYLTITKPGIPYVVRLSMLILNIIQMVDRLTVACQSPLLLFMLFNFS